MGTVKAVVLAVLAVVLVGGGIYLAVAWKDLAPRLGLAPKPHLSEPNAPPKPPVAVRLGTATFHGSQEFAEFQGTVQSRTVTNISAQIVAAILDIAVQAGQTVKKGDLLVRLDDAALKTRVEQAQAGLGVAQAAVQQAKAGVNAAQATLTQATQDLKRYQETFAVGAATRQQLEQAEAAQKTAAANLAQANDRVSGAEQQTEAARRMLEETKVMLSYAEIRSPRDAVVKDKYAEKGDLAAPGRTLLTLQSNDDLRFEAPLSERCVARIRYGYPAHVKIEAANLDLETRVSEIVPSVDPQSRSFLVRADLPLTPGLKPGTSGRIQFACEAKTVLAMPASALVSRGQLDYVFVVQEGRAWLRLVKVGRAQGQLLEVLSSLDAGEQVVLAPPAELQDGDPVKPNPAGGQP